MDLEIINGPAKFDLMLALFDIDKRRRINFAIDNRDKDTIHCVINGVTIGFDTEQWIITGRADSSGNGGGVAGRDFSAVYSTQTRKGTFSF
jgi:hypothetical protein